MRKAVIGSLGPGSVNAHCAVRGRWRALCWLALAGVSGPLCAAESHTGIMVSARVLPAARLRVTAAPPELQISAADVARGYVDAPLPLQLRVDSNSRAGFALDVSALGPWCTAVTLQGLDTEVQLDGAGGSVVQRWQNQGSRLLRLQVRFALAPGAQPATYAWPLRLAARPL